MPNDLTILVFKALPTMTEKDDFARSIGQCIESRCEANMLLHACAMRDDVSRLTPSDRIVIVSDQRISPSR